MNWIEKADAQIAEMTPETGYNVVAVDRMEMPGEALYFVGHFDDQAEAERARREHAAKTGDQAYVYGPKAQRTDDFDESQHPRDEQGKFAPAGGGEAKAKGPDTLKREKVAKIKATKLANAAKLKAELGTTNYNKVQGEKKAAANEKRRAAANANAAAKAQAKEEARKRALQGREAYQEFQKAGVEYANQVVANRGQPMSMEQKEYEERAYKAREAGSLAQKLTHEGVGEYNNSKENAYGYEPSAERAKLEAEQAKEREKLQGKLPLDAELTANAAADHERIERAVRNNAKMGEHARPEHEVRAEAERHIHEEREAKFRAEREQAEREAKAAAERAEHEAKVKAADRKLAAVEDLRKNAAEQADIAKEREEKARQAWEKLGDRQSADTVQAKEALRELQAARREANAAVKAQSDAERAREEAQKERDAFGVKIQDRDSNTGRAELEARKIAEIKLLGGGVSESWKVKLDDGTKAVWKSGDQYAEEAPDRQYGGKLRDNIDAGTYYLRNAAASAVAPLLGVGDLVPATVVHDPTGGVASGHGMEKDPNHRGSLQAWAEDTHMAYGTSDRFEQEAAERMRAADFVLGSTDRHAKNVMVAERDGKNYPVMIDNDLCLPKAVGDRFIQPMDHIPRGSLMDSTKALVKSYDHVAIARTLHQHGIEPEAVKLAVIRAERLRKNPDVLNFRSYGDYSVWQGAANARPTPDERAYADRVYKDAGGAP